MPLLEQVRVGRLNTTAETVALFRSCSFFVTTHSSQLKSLYFSLPNTAVVEVTGTFIPEGEASPFSFGMPELGIHYVNSKLHGTNLTKCGEPCAKNDKNSIITVNVTKLRSDMTTMIEAQRKACPGLVYPSKPIPGAPTL